MMATDETYQAVVVGAGFGGMWTARALARAGVSTLVLDRNNYHTFQALLYQVAAAELDPAAIAFPVRSILRRHPEARFAMREVTGLDLDEGLVRTTAGDVGFEYLVLGMGSCTQYFGVPGAAEHAFPLKTLEHGVNLRNHILHCAERASQERDPAVRQRLLTFAVVGGGATGVEFAGALAELIRGSFRRDYPDLAAGDMRVLLMEAGDRLLTSMPDPLPAYAMRRLRRMGVDVQTGWSAEAVEPDAVVLKNGERIPSATTVWTAGVQGHPLARSWGLPVEKDGRVRVEPTLQVEGRDNLYAVGDLARFVQDGRPLPLLAPVAIQEGEAVARSIVAQLHGKEPEAFRYRNPGTMATIGRNSAVVCLGRYTFTGFFAWFLWLAVHLVRLIGFRNRLITVINWAWDYFFFERAVRLILPSEGTARHSRNEIQG